MSMTIDVRTPEEYATGHVKGAVNIPLSDIEAGNLDVLATIDKNTPLNLYCRSGMRSQRASALLRAADFTQVTNIGGIADAMRIG